MKQSPFSNIPLCKTGAQAQRRSLKEPHFGTHKVARVKVTGYSSPFKGGSWVNEDLSAPDVGAVFER